MLACEGTGLRSSSLRHLQLLALHIVTIHMLCDIQNNLSC